MIPDLWKKAFSKAILLPITDVKPLARFFNNLLNNSICMIPNFYVFRLKFVRYRPVFSLTLHIFFYIIIYV